MERDSQLTAITRIAYSGCHVGRGSSASGVARALLAALGNQARYGAKQDVSRRRVRLTTAACDGSEQLSLGQRESIASMDDCTVILHDLP